MSFILCFIYFILAFPMPEEFDYSKDSQFRAYSRMIIVLLCLLNLHFYYCNLFL